MSLCDYCWEEEAFFVSDNQKNKICRQCALFSKRFRRLCIPLREKTAMLDRVLSFSIWLHILEFLAILWLASL